MRFRAATPLAKSHHPVMQPGKILKSLGMVVWWWNLRWYETRFGPAQRLPGLPFRSSGMPGPFSSLSPKIYRKCLVLLGPQDKYLVFGSGSFPLCLLCLSKLDPGHKVLFFLKAFCDPSHTHPKRSPSSPIRALPACDSFSMLTS